MIRARLKNQKPVEEEILEEIDSPEEKEKEEEIDLDHDGFEDFDTELTDPVSAAQKEKEAVEEAKPKRKGRPPKIRTPEGDILNDSYDNREFNVLTGRNCMFINEYGMCLLSRVQLKCRFEICPCAGNAK